MDSPETNQQSQQWISMSVSKKIIVGLLASEVMTTVFLYVRVIVHHEYTHTHKKRKFNGEHHADLLDVLKDGLKKYRPHLFKKNVFFHQLTLVLGRYGEVNELGLSDFFLFQNLTWGKRICASVKWFFDMQLSNVVSHFASWTLWPPHSNYRNHFSACKMTSF